MPYGCLSESRSTEALRAFNSKRGFIMKKVVSVSPAAPRHCGGGSNALHRQVRRLSESRSTEALRVFTMIFHPEYARLSESRSTEALRGRYEDDFSFASGSQ